LSQSDWVKETLEVLGWHQSLAARKCKCTRQFIHQIIHGVSLLPTNMHRYLNICRNFMETVDSENELLEAETMPNTFRENKNGEISISIRKSRKSITIKIQSIYEAKEITLSETDSKLLGISLLSLV
jgi:hypothetical protein